jgi:hypothetical protein
MSKEYDMNLGKLPTPVRHFILVVLAAVLTGLAELLPALDSIPSTVLPFLTAGITYLLAWVTPLVQGYGWGNVSEG